MLHAGRTVTVESAEHTFRVYDSDELLTEVARTTNKNIARLKVRKPEPPRRAPLPSRIAVDQTNSAAPTPEQRRTPTRQAGLPATLHDNDRLAGRVTYVPGLICHLCIETRHRPAGPDNDLVRCPTPTDA